MDEENNDLTPSSEDSKAEVQKILKEIPDDVLIGVIADRIQQEPTKEIKKVVETVSQ